ncbi:DNA polymerase III subunit chi [Oceanicaulis sp. AH-315-P02]|nr:DNA polymerase III subunit chi [Robiginitomaculum sp.]MBN4047914.1 DNA polymerase III subunit chi [Oceanicaulis sp. AH-315-P02]
MQIWFYHLEAKPLDQVLPDILEKCLSKNWRVLIHSPDEQRLQWLDQWLWLYREDSFLAHGTSQSPRADKQPILLTKSKINENGSDVAVILDSADPKDFQDYERTIVMFDGADDEAVNKAREYWKQAKAKQQKVLYWKQTGNGTWKNLA